MTPPKSRPFVGTQIAEDAFGHRLWRNIQVEDVRSLPRRDARVSWDGLDLKVVDYLPATWPMLVVEVSAAVRAMIRYIPATGEWGWCSYVLVNGPRLLRTWRDGYSSFEAALEAALR